MFMFCSFCQGYPPRGLVLSTETKPNLVKLAISTDEEADEIVAFLISLTGKMPGVPFPVLPAETSETPHPTAVVKQH